MDLPIGAHDPVRSNQQRCVEELIGFRQNDSGNKKARVLFRHSLEFGQNPGIFLTGGGRLDLIIDRAGHTQFRKDDQFGVGMITQEPIDGREIRTDLSRPGCELSGRNLTSASLG